MQKVNLSRRLLAAATGMLLGLTGAVALSAPAQARVSPGSAVVTLDCDATTVEITNGLVTNRSWRVNGDQQTLHRGGQASWKLEADAEVAIEYRQLGRWNTLSDNRITEIDNRDDCGSDEGDKKRKRWFGKVPRPSVTQPTCEDDAGYLHIPAKPRWGKALVTYKVNGDQVERGATITVEPGTYEIAAYFGGSKFTKPIKTWTKTIVGVEDCDAGEEDPPGEEEPPGEDGPPQDETPIEELGGYHFDCHVLTLHLVNIFDTEVTFVATPNDGTDPVSVTLAPGEEADDIEFAASAGLVVTISIGGSEVAVSVDSEEEGLPYAEITEQEWHALGCDAGDQPGEDNGEGGGELPVTGGPVALVSAAALVLLGLGVGLFMVARRRRIRFMS